MGKTQVTEKELNTAKTVDANGWTVNDLGSFKIYTKRISTTLSGFSGPAFITALASQLPAGVANHNAAQSVLSSFHYGSSGNMRVVQESNGTSNDLGVVGTTSAAFSGTIQANYTVIV